MGTSDSKMEEALDVARSKRINADKLSLAALRSQFTNSSNPSVDQAELTSARFRQEERLRAESIKVMEEFTDRLINGDFA